MGVDQGTQTEAALQNELAPTSVHYLVFSSGSIGGLSFVGAWKAIEEQHYDIRGFSGCSMGSIVALLASIGYNSSTMKSIAAKLKYKDIANLQIFHILDNFGVETGTKIMKLIAGLVEVKIGRADLTFQEHWNITGKKLYINASCVEDDRACYFSAETHPNMSVLTAIRMSISMPVLFGAVKWNGKTYIDGAFQDPMPVHMFPPEETLALRVINDRTTTDDEETYPFVKHISSILFSAYKRLHKHMESSYSRYRVVVINTGVGSMSMDISKTERKRLIVLGYATTRKQLAGDKNEF